KSIHDGLNGTGHFFGVLDVAVWCDPEVFAAEVGRAIATLKQTPRLDPDQPLYFPGELAYLTEKTRTEQGIPLPVALVQALANHFGLECVKRHLTPDLSLPEQL
ncbi:MAG: Ldh family oxidoreductase, partial [Rhodobacteraceae bacterium]|nr:Ldh family oxidoreductase [Paracoccaceae bacterium]